ncbi:acetyl-CoA C-acyltransferase [Allokutzneria oryzae]|uniref:Acetyl-CoA C-acyltransferase n=1 Tax=Allokutzneria oryzae TaxID=1378989 RepID=A0ABV6A1C5_9PSEU
MTAYLLDTRRTPRGKAKPTGGLASRTPLQLLEPLLTTLGGDLPIDDVILGCATQTGEQGGNIARTAAALAGWTGTPGMTLNRFCASGVDAISTAAAHITFGTANLVIAGGVESVSHAPMFSDQAPLYRDPTVISRLGSVHMGIAADLIATLEDLHRAELDAYGLRTQHRAAAAWQNGRHHATPIHDDYGTVLLDHDEALRPHTTADELAALPPAFTELGLHGQDDLVRRHHPEVTEIRHLHTVGTSPTLADAAAITLIGTAETAERHGLRPRARIAAAATAAVDPVIMLTAGQHAVQKLLASTGLHPDDIAVYEIAEAFAASCVKFERDLAITDDRLNPNGGTIAMGHAFGATGAILAQSCVDELERRNARHGIIAVSGAAGVGSALLLTRV